MQMPVFLILFLAPVYVPVDLLHGWIHAVARVNPVTPMLEAAAACCRATRQHRGGLRLCGRAAGAALPWAARGLRSAERAG